MVSLFDVLLSYSASLCKTDRYVSISNIPRTARHHRLSTDYSEPPLTSCQDPPPARIIVAARKRIHQLNLRRTARPPSAVVCLYLGREETPPLPPPRSAWLIREPLLAQVVKDGDFGRISGSERLPGWFSPRRFLSIVLGMCTRKPVSTSRRIRC